LGFLDVKTYEAVGPRGRAPLTDYQYGLLLALSRVPPGTVVPYFSLTLTIYGSDNVDLYRRALDRLTQRVRLVLRQVGYSDDLICTRTGIGLYINPAHTPLRKVTG